MNLDLATRLESDVDAALAAGDLVRAEALADRYRREAESGHGAQSTRFRSLYLSARVALDAGKLLEAGRHLLELLPPDDLSEALACRLWLLSAEVLARQGNADQARGHLGRAQAYAAALREQPLLKLREIRIRLWLGGDDAIEDAVRLRGSLADDRDNLALLLCEEGRAREAGGDAPGAAACWDKALPLATGSVRADVLIQQGRLAHLSGRFQEALDRYDDAARCGSVPQRQETLLRRALVLLDLNQPGHAGRLADQLNEPLADEVRPLACMVRSLLDSGGQGTTEARAFQAARGGDVERARSLYHEALAEGVGPARRARLALALGMLAVSSGDVAEAKRWLRQAEDLARVHRLDEVLWRCLQTRGRLAADAGEDEQARRLFEEAVAVCERQIAALSHRADAAAYGLRRADVLNELLAAAVRRGDAEAAFGYQELQRGRLLLELWRAAPRHSTSSTDEELNDLESRLAIGTSEAERQRLLGERERLLDTRLRDRSRATAAVPALASLADLQGVLKPGTLFVSPIVTGDELALLVCAPERPARLVRRSSAGLSEQIAAFRRCVAGQLERYRHGLPLGLPERREIDARLDALGSGPLGELLAAALDQENASRLVFVPDGELHGLPVGAIRRGGRYLIERHEVVYVFGGSLLYHQASRPARGRAFGPTVVLSESPDVLPAARSEGQCVAAAFWRSVHLQGKEASRAALRRLLPSARVLHLACHSYFDPQRPLSAHVGLPSGETWNALDWLAEPLDGLRLATLSACRSAEVGPLVGREVFGLATGLLGAGVRAVVAGVWPVADQEAAPLMERLYNGLMMDELPAALARAQREALARPDSSPLFWSAFGLFGDPDAWPAPRWPWRWFSAWRQRRHARRLLASTSPHAKTGA